MDRPLQSLVINRVSFTVDQMVEFKVGFTRPWRPGYIEVLEEHRVKVRAANGKRELVTIIRVCPRRPVSLEIGLGKQLAEGGSTTQAKCGVVAAWRLGRWWAHWCGEGDRRARTQASERGRPAQEGAGRPPWPSWR